MLFSLKSRKKEDKEKSAIGKRSSKLDDFEDDSDFPDSPVRRPTGTSKGDRKQEMGLEFLSDLSPELRDSSSIQAPPRARKTAGWSDDGSKKSWLRRGSKQFSRDSPKKNIMTDTSPMNDEIPVIPDLDTMKEEELSADVSKAPSLAMSRIATYQELDSDLSKHAAFQSLDGIDLTLLTKRLLPEHVVKMDDETPWTWDTLFADVSSHLNAAMAQKSNESSPAHKNLT